jgi:hypothetical protein
LLQTAEQYNYVKEMLVTRMSNYRRGSFKLQNLYEILAEKASTNAYIDISYQEFRNMFEKECIKGNIPNHTFTIAEEGYLDKKKRFPYANVQVSFVYTPKRKKAKLTGQEDE